jgi:6-pyruvoyltetrahydropterin/6-carboxytetrahydropterin synthase
MYELTVKGSFAAAHNLRNYRGKCEHLHGHNYSVEAVITASKLDKAGLAVDFGVIKKTLNLILEELDHKYLNNDVKFFKKKNPSAENIARYIFERLSKKIKGARTDRVSVYESENAKATYYK